MGEARRKKMLGITEPSNPKWKRRPKKLTQKERARLAQQVMAALPATLAKIENEKGAEG